MDILPKPFIKIPGGKRRLASKIIENFPQNFGTYYEPFLGGAAIFWELYKQNSFGKAVLSDTNPELILTYTEIKANPETVLATLKVHDLEHKKRLGESKELAKEYYYKIRSLEMDENFTGAAKAARMIYLNKTCFNGLYRVNKQGKFNVPFGSYKNPKIYDSENLLAVQEALKKATILNHDFEDILNGVQPTDCVYLDPPYYPLSKTSAFTNYTKEGFSLEDQVRLSETMCRLQKKDIFVLQSNSDTPEIRELYNWAYIKEVKVRRNINSKGNKRGPINELFICTKKFKE
jgi:DNA adenine methylase